MIEIKISVDASGCLCFLKAEGHSLIAPSGSNIVCAAVSSLLRSAVRVLDANKQCVSKINAKKDGFLSIRIKQCCCIDWLLGVTEVILSGLIEIEKEYPLECRIELIKGAKNGT